MYLRRINLLISVCFLALQIGYSQSVVNVGGGSYASYPPTHEMDGVFTEFAQNAEIDVAPGETRPIPTNEWWTSIIYDENDQLGGRLWGMPLVVDPQELGLNIYHPTKWNATGTDLMIDFPVVVRGEGFTPTMSIAQDWSDWSVDVKTYQDINSKYLLTKVVHGSPFVWIETAGFTPQIECYHNGEYLDANGNAISFPFYGEYFVIRYWDTYYGVHLPPGSNVTQGGTTNNLLTLNLNGNYFIMSALNNSQQVTSMHDYAYVKPTSTNLSWNYNTNAGSIDATWQVNTTNLRGAGQNNVMQGFIPHHYRSAISSNINYNGITYSQARGQLRMAVGNSFSFTYNFSGLVPHFTAPQTRAGDANPYNASVMSDIITMYANKLRDATAPPYAADTYWGGKDMVRMAKYMLIAKETGHAEYSYLLGLVKEAISNWCTYTPGETEMYYAWYPKWKALIGFNESYYSGLFTDNHFHYGYLIQAASLCSMVDQDFINQYSGILTMIAKQYACWEKNDPQFPFMRTFDPWMGHSYAGGTSSPNGNNQESTSEAMQSWHAMYFLGSALGNNDMRDAAAFGYLSEGQATLEYWFNVHGDIWPSNYGHDVVGILWPGGYVYGTYFGVNPEWIHGIQMLPISPAFSHFNLGFTPAEANAYYNRLKTEMYNFHVSEGNTDISDGGVVKESEVGDWGHVLLGFRSLFDAPYATQAMNESWNSSATDEYNFMRDNHEAGQTYYYAHALQNLGIVQHNYHMSIPTSATYYNSATGITTYVVYNPSSSAQNCVVYRDGSQVTSFIVPAHTLYNSEGGTTPVLKTIPGTIQAEDWDAMSGVDTEPCSEGGINVGWIDEGDWLDYNVSVENGGSYIVNFRVAADGTGAKTVQLQTGGTTLGTANFNGTGGWQVWTTASTTVSLNAGNQTIRVYASSSGFNINWIEFVFDDNTCSPTTLVPYIQVNGGVWNQTSTATLDVGDNIAFGPQPTTGGSWSWTGPNGFSGTTREVSVNNIQENQAGTYTAIYTNDCGTQSTVSHTISVNGVTPTGNLAEGKPAYSSSVENEVFPPENAFDGDMGTRWASAQSDPQWIYVDLGQIYSIDQVIIYWETAMASDYQIQVSNDASNWTTVRNISGNTSSTNDLTSLNTSGRYVRMYGTSRATVWGYSIWEFEVYGSGGTTPDPVLIHIEAEDFVNMNGIQLEATGDEGGGENVGWIDAGDWMDYNVSIPTTGSYMVDYRVASSPGGGQVNFEAPAGNTLAQTSIDATGGWQSWVTLTTTVNLSAGNQTIRLYAPSAGWNINWFDIYTVGMKSAASKDAFAQKNNNTEFMVFPNPVNDVLIVEGLNIEESNMQIFNALGQVMLSTQLTSSSNLIDVSQLSYGIYYVKVSNNTEIIRLIKH